MRGEDDLDHEEYLATIAVARLLLGPGVSLQAPPNLSDPGQREQLLAAGVDDWGGVSPLTPDHVNPERPWPQLDDLAATTRGRGFPAGRAAHRAPPVRPRRPRRRHAAGSTRACTRRSRRSRTRSTGLAVESARPVGRVAA